MRSNKNKQLGSSICSREELLHDITALNDSLPQLLRDLEPTRPTRGCKAPQDLSTVVVGSMDVCSLYPNCLLKDTAKHLREALKEGATTFRNTDMAFCLKYLAVTEAPVDKELAEFMPLPKGTTTLHSLITNEHQGQFHPAEKPPELMGEAEKTLAHGWAISKALEATYQNHFYTVGGEVHHQSDGGPQGLDTAVEGA